MADRDYERIREVGPLTAALEYADRGWRVFPLHTPDPGTSSGCTCGTRRCKSPGKHPRIAGWREKATIDREQIRRWWTMWPTANIGIVTGDGLMVVDVDPRNGGTESWRELETVHGRLLTWTVETGSGGTHFYLNVDREIRGKNGWRKGVDIKASGGYVVAPPSKHVEGSYRVLEERALQDAPAWLLAGRGDLPGPSMSSSDAPEAQLGNLAAPGDSPEERVRWTRDAVACIPNDERFDDRSAWVGIGHAIKASCGEDAQEEGLEIFQDFSERWTGPHDPEETERVWRTLGEPRETAGYRKLLRLAKAHGYAVPEEHPWHATNEFSALEGATPPGSSVITAALDDRHDSGPPGVAVDTVGSAYPIDLEGLMASIEWPWAWKDLREQLPRLHRLARTLPPTERVIFESIVLARLVEGLKSWPAAQQVWRSTAPADEGATQVIGGTVVLRAADPTEIDLEGDYMVDGLIPAASVGEVIADYSMGKTWLLVDLGLSVAMGEPFLGRSTKQGPVLYLAYEGQRGLWKRAAGWLRAHRFLPEEFTSEELQASLEGRLIVAKVPPHFDQAQAEPLIRDTVRHYGVRLVIIDTRGKSLGGELDENAADSANLVQGLLSGIAQDSGATVIAAHHKPLSGSNRGRGSSAWTQGADFAFTIDGTREDFENGKPVKLKTIKFRDDQNPGALAFRLRSPIEMRVNGTTWSSAVIEDARPQGEIPLSLRAQVFAEIRREPGRGKEKIRQAVTGFGHPKIDAAIEDLLRMGAVEDRGKPWRHRYYASEGWELNGLGDIRHIGDEFLDLADADETEGLEEAAPPAL